MNELLAQPAEEIPEVGPKFRAAAGTWFVALVTTPIAGIFLYCALTNAEGDGVGFGVAAVLFGSLAGWGWQRIVQSAGKTPNLPSCHYLLLEHLKFIINRTLNDTAVTAFFRPDSPGPGGATCLLVFLENYSSRRRHVRIRVGTAAALDLPRHRELNLVVLPGQAVAYRWPMRIYPDAKPGDYDLRLRLDVKSPHGPGRMLRVLSGKKHRIENTFAVSSASFHLQPGFSVSATATATTGPLAEPGYLTLASPNVSQPRFNLMRQISENLPGQAVWPNDEVSTPPWPAAAEPPPLTSSPACPP